MEIFSIMGRNAKLMHASAAASGWGKGGGRKTKGSTDFFTTSITDDCRRPMDTSQILYGDVPRQHHVNAVECMAKKEISRNRIPYYTLRIFTALTGVDQSPKRMDYERFSAPYLLTHWLINCKDDADKWRLSYNVRLAQNDYKTDCSIFPLRQL